MQTQQSYAKFKENISLTKSVITGVIMLWFKIIFLSVFFVVLLSLGRALFFLSSSDTKSDKQMVNALTLRIILSIFAVILLVIGYFSGLIQPNIP